MKRSTHKQIHQQNIQLIFMKKPWSNYILQTTKILKILITLTHYINVIQKVMQVIDLTTPIKSRQIKQNLREWFDGEVAEKISFLNNSQTFILTKK